MTNGITPIGDWQWTVKTALSNALKASVEVVGRTGAEACKHAIIMMAQSAVAMTKQAPKNRKTEQDPRFKGKGGQFMRVFKKNGQETKFFRFAFENDAAWLKAKNIANRGMAKRSWMWGLKNLDPSKVASRPFPGVTRMITISTEKTIGYILENALSYLLKILPAGWEYTVAQKVANKIMKQAVLKIENGFMREMRATRRAEMAARMTGMSISKFILRA